SSSSESCGATYRSDAPGTGTRGYDRVAVLTPTPSKGAITIPPDDGKKRRTDWNAMGQKAIIYALLSAGAIIFVGPFAWMFSASLQDVSEMFRRSEEHTSELQSRENLVCRLLLEKKKKD